MIPLAIPSLNGREAWYVMEALKAGEIATGAFIERFEQTVCAATGAKHAVAMSSGTAALHIALLLAGVKPDDEVIVPATTFIATARAVQMCGANPVILDVEPETWGLDPALLTNYVDTNRTPVRAVLPVHLYGHPCHLDAIRDAAERYGAGGVVEDAAEALGATSRGLPVGGDGLAALSFNGNKLVTTGGGGMLLTPNARQAELARSKIAHDPLDRQDLIYGRGMNYRLSNVSAAIGLAQMETLDERLKSKRETAEHYQRALPNVFTERPWARSSYWLSAVKVDNPAATIGRLAAAGIEARRVWRPLHRQPRLEGYAPAPCPVADDLYAHWITLPASVAITAEERETVIRALRS